MSHCPPGTAVRAEHQLQAVGLLERRRDVAQVVPVPRPRHLLERALRPVRVLVLVDVHDGEGAEVDRVGTGGVGAVVLVGVEDLHAQRLPASRGPAVHEAGPAPAEGAVLLLEVRDELVRDRVTVGPEVRGVHRVGVVVVRVRVLYLDRDHAGEARARPVLVELVGALLLDAVVAVELETVAVLALQVGVGRRLPPPSDRVGEVAVEDREGITRLRVRRRSPRAGAGGLPGTWAAPRTS